MTRSSALLALLFLLAACAPVAPPPEPTALPATVAPPTAVPPTPFLPLPSPTPSTERIVGVLLGADYDPQHPDRNTRGVRTDIFTIVVVDLPPGAPPVISFIQVSRDMLAYVPCSNLGVNRINAAWYLGGSECVKQTVLYNYGLTVNGPVVFGALRDFVAIVDEMGGVTITPGKFYNDLCGIMGTDTAGGSGVWKKWQEGVPYEMDGATALCYVRGRRTADGDLDRNRRALEFFEAAIAQWPKTFLYQPASAWGFFNELLAHEYIQVDANLSDALTVVTKVLPALPDATLRFFRWNLGKQVGFGHHEVWGSVLDSTVQPEKWVPCLVDLAGFWGAPTELIVDQCTAENPMLQPPVDQ